MATRSEFDTAILTRRLAYGCCAGNAVYQYVRHMELGDECCAEEYLHKAKLLMWGERMMNSYAISGEDDLCCVTDAEACQVMNIVDPFCHACGCGDGRLSPPLPSFPPILPPCDLGEPTYTLGFDWDALGISQCEIPPSSLGGVVFDSSLEFFVGVGVFMATESYTLTFPVMEIVAGGVYDVDELGNVTLLGVMQPGETAFNSDSVCDGSPGWWQMGINSPWPLFPPLAIEHTQSGVTVNSLPEYQAEQLNGLRSVRFEYTINGTDWIRIGPLDGIPEQAIANGTVIPLDASILSEVLGWRATYISGYCEYGPFEQTFTAPPIQDIQLLLGTSSSIDGFLYIYKGAPGSDPEPFQNVETDPTTSDSFEIVQRIERVDDSYIVLGGSGTSSLLYSQNNGASFVPSGGSFSALSPDYVTDIKPARDSDHVWAVLSQSRCALSDNRGISYSEVDITPITSLLEGEDIPLSVNAYNGQEAIIGGRDSIWKTSDGGATWTEVQDGMQATATILVLEGTDIVLAFDRQGVWRSPDRGDTWNFISEDTALSVNEPAYDAAAIGATVWTSTGWRSSDRGLTWYDTGFVDAVSPGVPLGFSKVSVLSTQQVLITMPKYVWATTNAGQSWYQLYDHSSASDNLYSMEVSPL